MAVQPDPSGIVYLQRDTLLLCRFVITTTGQLGRPCPLLRHTAATSTPNRRTHGHCPGASGTPATPVSDRSAGAYFAADATCCSCTSAWTHLACYAVMARRGAIAHFLTRVYLNRKKENNLKYVIILELNVYFCKSIDNNRNTFFFISENRCTLYRNSCGPKNSFLKTWYSLFVEGSQKRKIEMANIP